MYLFIYLKNVTILFCFDITFKAGYAGRGIRNQNCFQWFFYNMLQEKPTEPLVQIYPIMVWFYFLTACL